MTAVRRVLRRDGTFWLVVGDTYFGSWGNYGGHNRRHGTQRRIIHGSAVPNPAYDRLERLRPPSTQSHSVLKPKDLAGIPWRLATALQADGWWLRSDIIWSKTNPMPESVSDRPTKSHEYIFLLTKSDRYFYDAEAIKEIAVGGAPGSSTHKGKTAFERGDARMRTKAGLTKMSAFAQHNKRSVWTIAVEAFPGAHFAVFPKKPIEPCILAGTSEHGCCAACGAPWKRIVSRHISFQSGSGRSGHASIGKFAGSAQTKSGEYDIRLGPVVTTSTTGWKTNMRVLDPLSGAGTTGLVALRLGRNYIGIELNPEYVALSECRIGNDAPLFLKERHP